MEQILRRKDVERATCLSKATLYRMMNSGTFPKPVRLSERTVGWLRRDIEEWIESRERVGSESPGS